MKGYGRFAGGVLGPTAIAVAAALLLSACSEIGFPAVHDMPAPRADTTLTPDQVQQATDALISQRDHLSSEAQSNGQAGTQTNTTPTPQKTSLSSAQPAAAQAATSGTAQSAGADGRP